MNNLRRTFTIREFGVILAIFLTIILIVLYLFNANRTTISTASTKGIQVANGGRNEYSTVIKNGRYLVGVARGLTATSTDNQFNVTSFQNSLVDLSKNQFRTNAYLFQEGQYLSSATLQSWLSRYSEDNKNGLNPEDNGKTDETRNPIYLQTIQEDDFVNKDGNKVKLEGMTIGVSMNTVDTYTKEEFGAEYTQEIPFEEMQKQGREIAQKIIERVRKLKVVSDDMPIMIAMYANMPTDSLVGGSFYEYAVSDKGAQLGSWKGLNIKNVVFPKLSNDKSDLGNNENTSFVNFNTQISNFFPNISSATAQAQYQNGNIQGMNVYITTQFYSSTEIHAFTTFVAENAPKYLPNNIPIRIQIQTSNLQLAILTSNGGGYTVTYLDSY